MSHHYIKYSDVKFTYPGKIEALKGVSFTIRHGERVALLGRNGAGKSTLILLANGLLLADSGKVNIGDIPVGKDTLRLIRQSVGLVFQNPDDQLFMPTVEDDVAFGPINMGLPHAEIERRVAESLKAVDAEKLRHRSPSQLSGGEKRRVAIATVLSMQPSVLILDEPTSNLDFAARRDLINLLKKFDHTQLIATHDLEMVKELCPRIIILDNGVIAADGPTEDILSNPDLCALLGI